MDPKGSGPEPGPGGHSGRLRAPACGAAAEVSHHRVNGSPGRERDETLVHPGHLGVRQAGVVRACGRPGRRRGSDGRRRAGRAARTSACRGRGPAPWRARRTGRARRARRGRRAGRPGRTGSGSSTSLSMSPTSRTPRAGSQTATWPGAWRVVGDQLDRVEDGVGSVGAGVAWPRRTGARTATGRGRPEPASRARAAPSVGRTGRARRRGTGRRRREVGEQRVAQLVARGRQLRRRRAPRPSAARRRTAGATAGGRGAGGCSPRR